MLKINHNAKIRLKGFTPLEINKNLNKTLRPDVSSGLSLTGFTLIEVAISLAILAIIAGIFTPVISQGIDAMLFCRAKEQLAQEARLAMSWITEDLKNNCSANLSVGTTSVSCDKPGGGSFQYFTWSPAPSYIKELDRINNGVTQAVVAKPVRSFEVKGYSAVTTTMPLSSDPGYPTSPTVDTDVKIIQIKLSVGDASGPNHYDLITRIHPRLLP